MIQNWKNKLNYLVIDFQNDLIREANKLTNTKNEIELNNQINLMKNQYINDVKVLNFIDYLEKNYSIIRSNINFEIKPFNFFLYGTNNVTENFIN